MKLSPFRAVCLGALLATGCVMLLGAGLTKWVGQFVGDGSGLTNVVAGGAAYLGPNVSITNQIARWQLDATFEDIITKHDTHGIDLDYNRIDGGSSVALFRSIDGTFHFTQPPYIDGNNYLGNALGVDPITGQIVPISGSVIINNFFSTNIFATTAYVDVFNSYSNTFILFQSNVVFNQKISVVGHATFNDITVTNQLQFLTNAFPLAAGTSWNLTKPYQRIITNADFVIGSLGALTNNVVNWGVLWWSNSDSATHFCDMTALAVTPQGPNSTNKLYVAAGKTATISIASWGVGQETNLVTALGQ